MNLNGTSNPLQELQLSTELIRFCNENSFEVNLNGTSDPSQEPQMSIEPTRSVETMSTHAPATVRMEPHVIIFQRAPGNASLQFCFQTFLPALNWAVREKSWKQKRATSCERAVNDQGARQRTRPRVDNGVCQS